jgi:hypothetical protein
MHAPSQLDAVNATIQPCFLDPSRKSVLWPQCENVLSHEHFQNLPQRSLICIFDNEERQAFVNEPSLGENFCGFTKPGLRGVASWPPDILRCVWDDKKALCDDAIYLRSRTCKSQIGTVITFAHEMQHFMQYGNHRKVWQANHDLRACVKGRFPQWHFPHEREALLVSRQVAEAVLCPLEVQRYAEQEREREQVERPGDLRKWEFLLSLNVREKFDFLEETKTLVNEHRECLKQHFPYRDYSKEKWWE